MMQPVHTITTHAGAFHADEIMAIALLERFYLLRPLRVAIDLDSETINALIVEGQRPEVSALSKPINQGDLVDEREPCWIVRTRSPNLLDASKANPETFVLDVGGEFNADMLNLDHHQASMTDTWDDGTPYSSTGLVWRWLQANDHLRDIDPATQREMEDMMIKPLDAHDNGVAVCNEGMVIDGYNRSAGDNEEQAWQFSKALEFMREVLSNTVYRASVKMESRRQLEKAWEIAQASGDTFVVLTESVAYSDATGLLKEISDDQAQMLAIPSKGSGKESKYSVISISGNEGRFSIKCPVPEAWRGRMDFDVEIDGKETGIAFAHKTGFMCVVKGSYAEAYRVAKHVVAQNEPSPSPVRKSRPGGV